MALPLRPIYSEPIPNSPFQSPLDWYICGPYLPLIVGTGLCVNNITAYICSTGGGGGAVTSVNAGTAIAVSNTTGNVTVCNTGVTCLLAGTGISVSANTGAVMVCSTVNGTVTGINTGTGLTGGPITTSGTIALAPTGATAGVYTNPTLTINGQGQVTNAVSNPAINTLAVAAPITSTGTPNPTIGISAATTTACGAVQLSSALNDPAEVCAATTCAVKTVYDIAVQAIPRSCIIAKGTLITGTAPSTPVALPVGANGFVLTADSTTATGLKWGPPGGTPATPNYGSFLSTQTQTIVTPGTPQPVTVDTTVASNNFRVDNGSQFVATVAGTYNLQFSIQLFSNPGGGGDVEIWLNKGVFQVPNTNTRFHIKNTNEAEFAALNFVETLGAEEYLELYWSTADNDNVLYATTGPTALGGPAIPSVIITIVPVGA